MAAYVIARLTVTNPERYPDYTAETPALIAKHGGQFIVRRCAPDDGTPRTLN